MQAGAMILLSTNNRAQSSRKDALFSCGLNISFGVLGLDTPKAKSSTREAPATIPSLQSANVLLQSVQ